MTQSVGKILHGGLTAPMGCGRGSCKMEVGWDYAAGHACWPRVSCADFAIIN